MPTPSTLTVPARKSRNAPRSPLAAGLPDPRPVTDYDVVYEDIAGKSRITITLDQPCVIRTPNWSFIDVIDGSSITADEIKVEDNVTIVFGWVNAISKSVTFVEVPYQDVQVQNFQGGFVRPGGKWFREPH